VRRRRRKEAAALLEVDILKEIGCVGGVVEEEVVGKK